MHTNGHEEEEEHWKVPYSPQWVIGHQEGCEDVSNVVKLMADADEDEGGDEHIGHWVGGDEH